MCRVFFSLTIVAIGAFQGTPALAQSTTLTFEDLDPSPASYDVMPSPYQGFTFSGWFYGPDTVYTPASGIIDLFTDYYQGDPSALVVTNLNEVSRATPFVFEGASFSGFSGVQFELYLGGSLVATSATLPDAGATAYGPTWLPSGYGGAVDSVKVAGVQGYFAMDDFTYQEVSAIPEPASYAMLIGGLLVVAGLTKRHRT